MSPPPRPISRCLGSPRGSPRPREQDASLPTSATDLRHEHPKKPPDSRARSLRRGDRLRPALRGDTPWMQRSTASDHLAAIRPQVNRRLTTPTQLRSARSCSSAPGGRESAAIAALPRSGVFDRGPRRKEPTSDAPCCPPRTRLPGASKDQDRFPRPFVKRSGFPGPKRLPSTSAAAEAVARHRAHSLAAGEPASDAPSPPPMRCRIN